MPTHGSVARSERERKEAHPERYCRHPRCLWRTVNARTGAETPCPKHPEPKLGHNPGVV